MSDQFMVFDKDQLIIVIGALIEEKVRSQNAGQDWQVKRAIITANTLIDMCCGKPGYLDEEQLEQVAGALERAVQGRRGMSDRNASQALWIASRLREIKAKRESRFYKAPYVMVKGKRMAVLLKASEVAAYLRIEKTARGERTA
ncbi:hypothetical protein [Brevibacillus brevis]|uniref:hypothetical protein n=1 Tax=Brevibacillus brevis TaxID=1393 RepID=UPI0037C4FD0D